MYEEMTYERLLEDVLNNAPKDIDTRPGSIFYDAVSGVLLKIARLYADLDQISEMTLIMNAAGEALDKRAVEYGLARLPATTAKYYVLLEGTQPKVGERFYNNGKYFVLRRNAAEDIYYLEAETPGSSENDIYAGTPAVPVNNIDGLISATFNGIYENGGDTETDDSLRTRIEEKLAGPAENGNRQHYKTWCESIDGVGRARIFPLWNGENTVKAVLIDTVGKPCGPAKVAEVQKYIDPADKGMTVTVNDKTYTLGDGLGNGQANIGAHFTAAGANPLEITVSFSAELAPGATVESVKEDTEISIEQYLKNLVLNEPDNQIGIVRVSAIGAILSGCKLLLDYSNLRLNGETKNVIPSEDDVPVLSEVKVN